MIRLRKDQVEILQRLSKPEALHFIAQLRFTVPHVLDGRMAIFRACRFINVLEHAPGCVLEGLVACDSVHDENGFEGFGSVVES